MGEGTLFNQSLCECDSDRLTFFFKGGDFRFIVLVFEGFNSDGLFAGEQFLLFFWELFSDIFGPVSELFKWGGFKIDFFKLFLTFVFFGLDKLKITYFFSMFLKEGIFILAKGCSFIC